MRESPKSPDSPDTSTPAAEAASRREAVLRPAGSAHSQGTVGRPDRYRVTVGQDRRQYVHAGDGVGELRWELPERLAEVRPAGVIA
ncbi:hypothetical protein SAMN05216223_11874 [Actinacidiphila yanglinensis]|uniref:Uncharacterized protein n=1 Tax=Actinacidiphila yanglinensis TaxID=310779 RepID=A0A1H6DPW5_9ACTN|nr:hypothetical protein [Actinacidiphila yanglinensis]SEG87308.1 hypothetical protein SAMN05216223_11874 [Actinacidiphila yanglinensis]